MATTRHLLDLSDAELGEWLAANGEKPFRVKQIRKRIFAGRVKEWSEMTDLPKALREKLAAEFHLWSATISHRHISQDETEKLLLQMHDGHRIECVLLKEQGRRAICISTQVGCAMGCVFCASGLEGVVRNLTTGEILEQILQLDRLLPADERLSHIVVMGMGEPLANLDRLLPALAWASSPEGLGIGGRKITISTVGLTKALDKLADLDLPYHLAVSLHAPNDALRRELVPISKNIGIDAVLASADRFFEKTGRRVTYEYVLLSGVNDQPAHARELAELLGERNAFVNLIPFNAVEGLPYRDPSPHAVKRFTQILESQGVQVAVRKRKGDRINAACGQLRRSKLQAVEPAVVSLTLGGKG